MLKIKNVLKSNESKQVYDIASVIGNTATYVEIGVPSHAQYNNDVLNGKAQYIFDTENNVDLFNAIDENVDFTRFVTIGDEAVISGCITMHDIIDFYSSGCIQQFYECFCESHTDEESITLARFLSAIGIEIWKNITCYGGIYSGRYMVSNMGRVKSLPKTKQAKLLKQDCNPCGYMYVHLCHNSKMQNIRVNRLVAMTFYGEPTEQLVACHSNTNNLDNRLFNLEFKTQSENMLNPLTLKKCKESAKTKSKSTASTSTPTTTV